MSRRIWRWIDGALVEITHREEMPVMLTPTIIGDLPDYVSPVTGKVISGRAQRREDLRRTDSRPWEGMEQEKKEAARQQQYVEQRSEQRLDEAAWRAYRELPVEKRRILRGD
jgi:hypothetical protein